MLRARGCKAEVGASGTGGESTHEQPARNVASSRRASLELVRFDPDHELIVRHQNAEREAGSAVKKAPPKHVPDQKPRQRAKRRSHPQTTQHALPPERVEAEEADRPDGLAPLPWTPPMCPLVCSTQIIRSSPSLW